MLLNNWRVWLAFLVSGGLLAILVLQVDPAKIGDALSDANYWYIIPAVALYFVAVYFRALRWRFLLSPLRVLPVKRLYPVVVIGYLANNVLPARLGEVVRSYYLSRREPVATSSALATVAVERVYDGITLLAWAAVAGLALLLLGEFDGTSGTSRTTWIVLAALTVLLFTGALVFLTLLATHPKLMLLVDRLLAIIPVRWGRHKAREIVTAFIQGLSILDSPRKHLYLFILSMPVWLFEGAMYFIVSYSFGIDDYFGSWAVLLLVVALLTATSNLATSIPVSIGGIGAFEVVAQQTLLALGVAEAGATVYPLVLHIVALWLPVNLAGLFLLWQQNVSLKSLTGRNPTEERASEIQGGGPVEAMPPSYQSSETFPPMVSPKDSP